MRPSRSGPEFRPRPEASCSTIPSKFCLHAPLIEAYAVRSQAMPPGNITEMTSKERLLLASWLAAGAPAK